ncbi:MAG: L-glutamate gamma-semialdehyde dehydrogenase [Calditrichia bacterium]
MAGRFNIPKPVNEPILSYGPGSREKELLKAKLKEMRENPIEIPVIIGGKEYKTNDFGEVRAPHNHSLILAKYYKATPELVQLAIEENLKAREKWAAMDWHQRASVFLKAAELLAGPWRYVLNAATMLGQSKNAFQAEIDSACELIDFWRFNPWYMQQIYEEQPPYSPSPTWNRTEFRPLEGFIFAITPFNFTSIGGNLPTSPAMMGNVVLWKPAQTSLLSSYYIMKLLEEAGLPAGVINFIPGTGRVIGDVALKHPDLAGIHFTGSTNTFQFMWKTVGENIKAYKTYPRIVGETGGKDFVFVHQSADVDAVVAALVRGAFEYQGQKCSAASRAYIPRSLWDTIREKMVAELKTIKMGDVENFTNFMNAVIDKPAFDTITEYIDYAKKSEEAEIVYGGNYDDSKGYFIDPTVVLTTNPHFKLMEEEIFGPVLTIYVYEDEKFEETLKLCDTTSPYGLTGAVFAQDRNAIVVAEKALVNAAGNFYINDKPTGAVVGQQPFGGSRASGTNDKAGSALNLLRWVSQRSVKENFNPPKDYRYPFMAEE